MVFKTSRKANERKVIKGDIMYEHLRNEFKSILFQNFNTAQIELILSGLDKASVNYEVTEKSTALEVYTGGVPREVTIYLQTMHLEGKSDRTLKLYKLRLEHFFNAINKPLQYIETNDIRLYLAMYPTEHNIKDVTLEKIRQIINVFFVWCVREDYLLKNPCGNIKKIKYEDTTRKALTRFQLEKLRRACRTKRERAIVEVLYSTGARVTELVNMKRSEINPANKSIEVLGKGKRKYTVYFNESAQVALGEYDDSREDNSDWLFVKTHNPDQMSIAAVERIFQKLSARCGFYVCPHIMRHTFATMALQGGANIDVVQKALNHKSVATTQRYAETSLEDVLTAHRKYVV